MEKPKWAFDNVTYFNHVKTEKGKNIIIFSDFEHNWDLFQFLTNDNEYYFNLNKNIKTEYNVKIIQSTYLQKCKHLNNDIIHFILLNEEQETFLKKNEFNVHSFFKRDFVQHFKDKNIYIDENLINHFNTYTSNDAISILNDQNKFEFDENELTKSVEQNINKRSILNHEIKKICFFGASVTQQKSGYVDYLINHIQKIEIIKKGYSGCHINQAMWLVDDMIALKPDICFLEWTTSVFKANQTDLLEYLYIIINKLIKNNIIPVFLYLYKKDISDYIQIIDTYEKIAEHYNVSSFHQYKIIEELEINSDLFLKDTCHTNFQGSQFYGITLQKVLNDFLVNNSFSCKQEKNHLLDIEKFQSSKYNNIQIIHIDDLIDTSDLEFEVFDNKKYVKITNEAIIHDLKSKKIIAINLLYYKNNGFIMINNTKIQTWDSNCYYKRYGYINLNIKIEDEIKIVVSQEIFDTPCKYDTAFPNEKYLFISEIICI